MLKARQKFGKYVIERKLGLGGFAVVYQARDTIEGIRVALKLPHSKLVTEETLEDFRREVRVATKLDHPNILPIKYADYIAGHFVIVSALGEMSLDQRLQRRLSTSTALDYAEQMLAAAAYAHENHIIHCDIKPDNFLLFPGNRLRLADFGIARVARQTLRASGTGTVGYIAPEQAMGRPSFRSDVFSLGLLLYRMFSGHLPEWPYDWPPPGHARLRHRVPPELVALIRRSMELNTRKRFRDAAKMLAAFKRIKPSARKYLASSSPSSGRTTKRRDWQAVRRHEFLRQFGRRLETRYTCAGCEGPVSEFMTACPWCGKQRKTHRDETQFPARCPRCRRGIKLDWHYCPWCYGAGFQPMGQRSYSDVRYSARCDSGQCERRLLMPFMRYCPWCHRRVQRKWKIEGSTDKCPRCGWGVLRAFWSYCPWCGRSLTK